MRIFVNLVAAAAMVNGWISTREGIPQLGATSFAVALTMYVFSTSIRDRAPRYRGLELVSIAFATLGLASSVFIIHYEAAKQVVGKQ